MLTAKEARLLAGSTERAVEYTLKLLESSILDDAGNGRYECVSALYNNVCPEQAIPDVIKRLNALGYSVKGRCREDSDGTEYTEFRIKW